MADSAMGIAIAGWRGMTPEFRDDEVLLERLAERGVEGVVHSWDAADVDWDGFDLVVARTVWDYVLRHDEFLAWLGSVRSPVENVPEMLRWNGDKRYVADLAEAGLPVVETSFVAAGDEVPPIEAEVVIKPTVSAGGRDTGRFGPDSAGAARGLIDRITATGRTAMVQPYLAGVEKNGETAVVMIDGRVSHVLRKGAMLRPDEVAPIRLDDDLNVAEAMYDLDLVLASSADPDELELAERVISEVTRRFSSVPLYARVDMLRDDGGAPVLLELEAVEPNLYFPQAPDAADRLADAIVARARERGAEPSGPQRSSG